MFFSEIPSVVSLENYDTKTLKKGKYKDKVKGDIAEQVVFKQLKKWYEDSKDDVLVLHSHQFLDSESSKEKDFIVVNLTKGYVFIIEVKSNANKLQTAKKQLLDGKTRIDEIFGAIGLRSTAWKYAGIFVALHGSVSDSLLNCENDCSTFAIIGEDNFAAKFKEMEATIIESHQSWDPSKHVDEFIDLSQELLFIAQGNPLAPVTGSKIVEATCKAIDDVSTVKNIFFWTIQQLDIIQAELLFVLLDAFYSTGKTIFHCKLNFSIISFNFYVNLRLFLV